MPTEIPNEASTSTTDVASLFADYQPPSGSWDEFVAPDGTVRSHCLQLVEQLEATGSSELNRRWNQAQRSIREDGITFNVYDESGFASRPWELDAVPMVLPAAEWQGLSEGLAQRAELLDRILEDLYGPRHLISDQVIPPELVLANPGFSRAFDGLTPPKGRRLQLYAADMARTADGRWWVTGDRTRAPSGLGYVLENRVVTSQMLPGVFRKCRVQRLASFFRTMRESLSEQATRFRDNPRIVLLTEGPASDTFFEDAYLARYLGYTLGECGDLAVRENRLMLKTLGGLLPVEVVLRRIHDDASDPVELNGNSAPGVPGLLEVIRAGNLSVSNCPGSWLVESPAFLAFLPSICRYLLNQELRIPSVATWWCGDDAARKHVLENLEGLIVRPAFRRGENRPTEPAEMDTAGVDRLRAAIQSRPDSFVAQERLERSTAPVLQSGRLQPWYVALRLFLTSTGNHYEALPGGLIRVSPDRGRLDRSMTSGERSQDLWILSDGPVETTSLLKSRGDFVTLQRSGSELPSRLADNLFWLGRSVERADGLARLMRTVFGRLGGEVDQEKIEELPALLRTLAALGQIEPGYALEEFQEPLPDLESVLPDAIFHSKDASSLRSALQETERLGQVVRDCISQDAWRTTHHIGGFARRPHRPGGVLDVIDVLEVLDRLINELAAFGGHAWEGTTRTFGWRFLDLGRRIERAWQATTLLLETLVDPDSSEPAVLESVLETTDSIMTYRSRYLSSVEATPALDLLVTDESNPRSIVFQLASINEHVAAFQMNINQPVRGQDERLALSMLNSVRLTDAIELGFTESDGRRQQLEKLLQRLNEQLPRLSDAISNRYLIHAGTPRRFAILDRESE